MVHNIVEKIDGEFVVTGRHNAPLRAPSLEDLASLCRQNKNGLQESGGGLYLPPPHDGIDLGYTTQEAQGFWETFYSNETHT